MIRSFGLFFVSPLLFFGIRLALQSAPVPADQRVRIIPITRSLHLPLIKPEPGENAAAPNTSPNLAFSPGGVDEPPEGPDGFDVLDDGRLLITDPLHLRISVFDTNGQFLQGWPIGFAADSITADPKGVVFIREARTSKVYTFDRDGRQHAGTTEEHPSASSAQITNPKSGVVNRPCGQPITVKFDASDISLLSLETLETDPPCVTFVALETSARGASGDAIDVRKLVRRYSGDGRLVSETTDLPLDYYIIPVNELRVRHGVVYQLRTSKTEVSINEWDMN